MSLSLPQQDLREFASSKRAKVNEWFFKTGPGQYGEGDIFIGVSVPDSRKVALKHAELNFTGIAQLLKSEFHEDRLLGLLILVDQYKKSKTLEGKKKIVNFYIKKRQRINNWDLVDLSAAKILGSYCLEQKDQSILEMLLHSKRHWDRRLAIVATYSFIKEKKLGLTFKFAKTLLNDKEDLMHKATGWMLREAGKRDKKMLLSFIIQYGKKMPRTMLRYSIEKLGEAHRKKILLETKAR